MGGPGSGRPMNPTGLRFARRETRRAMNRVLKRLRIDHAPIDIQERHPETFVVEGLKRKDVSEFIEIVRSVRNAYARSKCGRKRKGT